MRICIVGTGYVGLVSAACFAEMGNDVVCVDNNIEIVNSLKKGIIHIFEPGLEELVKRNYQQGRLCFTTRMEEGIRNSEAIFICVGTPPREDGSCDLGFVEKVAQEIGQKIDTPTVVVDKSTVPVGTADLVSSIIQKELDARGANLDFSVVSNPEFLKEGDAVADFMKPDRVIVGSSDPRAITIMETLYAPFARTRDKLMVMNTRSAEMTKYAANCMLATKISFINEIANICEKVGANVNDVRLGIGADQRIGYHFIHPGVGYGGSCFPKDVKALIHTAKKVGAEPQVLEAVEKVNAGQKELMADKVKEYFSDKGGVKGKVLALWGLAFKANTDDMREAASINIINSLTEAGMKIVAYDPQAIANAQKTFSDNPKLFFKNQQYLCLEGADALLVVTEWNQFRTPDFSRIKEKLKYPVIFDGRNLYSSRSLKEKKLDHIAIGKGETLF